MVLQHTLAAIEQRSASHDNLESCTTHIVGTQSNSSKNASSITPVEHIKTPSPPRYPPPHGWNSPAFFPVACARAPELDYDELALMLDELRSSDEELNEQRTAHTAMAGREEDHEQDMRSLESSFVTAPESMSTSERNTIRTPSSDLDTDDDNNASGEDDSQGDSFDSSSSSDDFEFQRVMVKIQQLKLEAHRRLLSPHKTEDGDEQESERGYEADNERNSDSGATTSGGRHSASEPMRTGYWSDSDNQSERCSDVERWIDDGPVTTPYELI